MIVTEKVPDFHLETIEKSPDYTCTLEFLKFLSELFTVKTFAYNKKFYSLLLNNSRFFESITPRNKNYDVYDRS